MDAAADLVVARPEGLYCAPGDFFIDPWRPVERAVITHAHADHARRGHGRYLASAGSASLLLGYSFGKAQRLLAGVDAGIGPIVVHGAVLVVNDAYRAAGVALPPTHRADELKGRAELKRALIVAPPSANGSPWLKR